MLPSSCAPPRHEAVPMSGRFVWAVCGDFFGSSCGHLLTAHCVLVLACGRWDWPCCV